eukprot:PhF_6_TR8662/c0_g1_i1/m.13542
MGCCSSSNSPLATRNPPAPHPSHNNDISIMNMEEQPLARQIGFKRGDHQSCQPSAYSALVPPSTDDDVMVIANDGSSLETATSSTSTSSRRQLSFHSHPLFGSETDAGAAYKEHQVPDQRLIMNDGNTLNTNLSAAPTRNTTTSHNRPTQRRSKQTDDKDQSVTFIQLMQASLDNATVLATPSISAPSTREIITGVDADGNKLVNEYAMIVPIGHGAYGEVTMALDSKTDKLVAIKVLCSGGKRQEIVQQEIDIMRKCRHPNLVKLQHVIRDVASNKLYLVMEYMEGGSLGETPEAPQIGDTSYNASCVANLSISKVRLIFLDVLRGLQFLHGKGVIHMDIKPENILLDKDGAAKLSDFGVSTVLEESCMRHDYDSISFSSLGGEARSPVTQIQDLCYRKQGTPLYFAPEMLAKKPFHGRATDVWAIGVALYTQVFGRLPFHGKCLQEYFDDVANHESIDFLHKVNSEKDLSQLPPLLLDVLRRTLEKEPSLRITVSQLIGHPFFVGNVLGSRVPLSLWVRFWKERRIATSDSSTEKERLVRTLQSNIDTSNQVTTTFGRGSKYPPQLILPPRTQRGSGGSEGTSTHRQDSMVLLTPTTTPTMCTPDILKTRRNFFTSSKILDF